MRYDRKAKLTRWTFKRRFRRALPAGRYKLDVRGVDPRNNRESKGLKPRYLTFRLR